MMKRPFCLVCLAVLALLPSVGLAQQFSADMTDTNTSSSATKHINVVGSRVRLQEDTDLIILFDEGAPSAFNTQFHTYLKLGELYSLSSLVLPHGVEDACRVLEYASEGEADGPVHVASWSCRQTGKAILNGRPAIKFAGVRRGGEHYEGWIDVKLGFMAKLVIKEPRHGAIEQFEITNIHEAPQPASLFVVPEGYRQVAEFWDLGKPEKAADGSATEPGQEPKQ